MGPDISSLLLLSSVQIAAMRCAVALVLFGVVAVQAGGYGSDIYAKGDYRGNSEEADYKKYVEEWRTWYVHGGMDSKEYHKGGYGRGIHRRRYDSGKPHRFGFKAQPLL